MQAIVRKSAALSGGVIAALGGVGWAGVESD